MWSAGPRKSAPYQHRTAVQALVIAARRQYIQRMRSARLTLTFVELTAAAFAAAIADLVLVSPGIHTRAAASEPG